MKLLRVSIISAPTCGGLLDGFEIQLRSRNQINNSFSPLCFLGPNGSGKSQFLQIIAEIMQSICHACVPSEERIDGNQDLEYEIEYAINVLDEQKPRIVRASRLSINKKKAVKIETLEGTNWVECNVFEQKTKALLPTKIIGYTSGGNETLSLPFFISRGAYAEEIGNKALDKQLDNTETPDPRLMLVDYGTHLEVLVANLLTATDAQIASLLGDASIKGIHSFRCTIQLAHSAAPQAKRGKNSRKGVQLTQELETYIVNLQRCSTCYNYDERSETYTFDFRVDEQSKLAFRYFWNNALELYAAFHKLAMLNDLAIPKLARQRFKTETRNRRFASRLPEPQDEDKVFRFERVNLVPVEGKDPVDYVSLSDGEHQLGQILGTLCMISFPGVLFLLDEPESHFNPQWRVKFVSKVLDVITAQGIRRDGNYVSQQECIITTHAPFVPSDMHRDKVFIFTKENGKVRYRHPDVETYGTTFDSILQECFDVHPPISKVPLTEIGQLLKSNNSEEIEKGMKQLGHSVEKVVLADRLRQLKKQEN
jgi:restriction system-associated AAA family ATPase